MHLCRRINSNRSREGRSASSETASVANAGSNLVAVAEDASAASLGMERLPVTGTI